MSKRTKRLETTERRRKIDIRYWRRLGLILDDDNSFAFNCYGEFVCVEVVWTQLNFGGSRPWFICPCCVGRVAILYFGNRLACRKCHGLTYASRQECPEYRAIRRANAIRSRLGWVAGIVFPKGEKPLGLHWKTFERLSQAHDRYARVYTVGMTKRLEVLIERCALLERLPNKNA